MAKDAVFTMKLEPGLRDAFLAAAERSHRPATQVVKDLMRDFVHRSDHAAFVEAKVETARRSVRADDGRDDDEVEGDFIRRRSRASDPS